MQLFWYLIIVEHLVRKENSINADVKENTIETA
jgi:hypothetical protein